MKSIKLTWNFYVDWFGEEGDDLEQLIKSHFLSSAMFLEEEAKEKKITSNELKAAVEFFQKHSK